MESEKEYCKKILPIIKSDCIENEKNVELANEMKKDNINNILNYKDRIFSLLSEEYIKKIISEFEFYNITIDKEDMTFEEFVNKCVELLNRYTYTAGGFRLEDNEWTIFRKGAEKYDLHENEIIFENSVLTIYEDDYETTKFLNRLIELINNICDKYIISCAMVKCERSGISWILLVVKENIKK